MAFSINMTGRFGGISRALSHREYRRYFLGNFTSTVGRWMYRMSVGWLTWELTKSTSWLGIVAFADLFPMVVIPVFAGVIADRAGYVRLMRWTVLGAGLATALFAALVALGGIDIEVDSQAGYVGAPRISVVPFDLAWE